MPAGLAPSYDSDFLRVWRKDPRFLRDPAFVRAYGRGMDSGHAIGRPAGSSDDIHIEWRIHVLTWAAWHASRLPGDFVECGVNTGIFSLAVCDFIDFNATGKAFYLFDTYRGIPVEQVSEGEERQGRLVENSVAYFECFERARDNFAPFPRAHLVRGRVPDTFSEVEIESVCYLSIDMNIVEPEIAAIEYFWPRLVPGAPVVLDDYGWGGYEEQKAAMDCFAEGQGVKVLLLPTGQGLLLKP